jgi:serine/threonine-protein kinase
MRPGTRLGPYEILSALGAGGMGEVYRARDTTLDRDVAVKILPGSFASDPDRLMRFTREAKTLAALNHPNIAQIYGVEESASTGSGQALRALVMELVEGEDLSTVIARGPIPLADALPIARQIADALEAAHEAGIVHRDLKPANIKVRADGTVKVLDFGLAKALDPAGASSAPATAPANSPTMTSPALTSMGLIVGTAAYMAPEQAKGRAVDKRADIWAFGVVLYEMLTRSRLFEAEDVSETLAAVLTRDLSLTSLPQTMPPRLRRLLRDCLVRDPRQRLRDIGDARIVLDQIIAGTADETPTGAAATAPAAGVPRWQRAVRWGVAAAATMAVGGAVWMLKPEPVRTVMRFSIALPEGQTFSNTGRQIVAVSPDGTNLAYTANSRLYLRPLSGLEARAIAGSETDAAIGPAFSPDGQSVVFYSAAAASPGGSLKRVAVAGGAAAAICPATLPLGLSWDETGIVFGQVGKGILRVAADGGHEPEVIAAAGADEVLSSPHLLPGARAVLFSVRKGTASWDEAAVVVQPLDGGARKTLVQGASDGRYLPTGHLVYAVSGVLQAVPFDPEGLTVTGGSVPLVQGVRRTLRSGPTGTGGAQFSASSTGLLAFVPGPVESGLTNDNDLAVFDRKGNAQPLRFPPANYLWPRVSPNGKSVAFGIDDTREISVWLYDLAGGTAMRRLTFGGRNMYPIWSADGEWVAFWSDRDGDRAIFRQRADGSGVAERLTKPEGGSEHVPQAFSPDGAALLYSVSWPRVEDRHGPILWTLSMKDRSATPFGVEQSAGLVQGAFSPDGRWVAYQARGAGAPSMQTFLEPFPRTGAKYLVGAGGHPYWSPKGDELILNVNAGVSVIVPVKTTPAVTFGQPVPLSRAGRLESSPINNQRGADSLPDGEHIIGVASGPPTATADRTSEIVVVLNWFDDVRQKVGAR